MDFYTELMNTEEEQRGDLIHNRIEEKEKEANDNFKEILGYRVGEESAYSMDPSGKQVMLDVRCFHEGFISSQCKIVYGAYFNRDGFASNRGNYYYLDNHDYLEEFCHFITNYELRDEYDFFDVVLIFLRNYFGTIPNHKRDEMFQLMVDDKGNYLSPTTKHTMEWFHKNGNAMCSEFAVMAQNILTLFGYESFVIIGQEKTGNTKEESHAFNLLSYYPEGEFEPTHMLIDFSGFVNVYDTDFHKIGESPYIGYIEDLDEELMEDILLNEKHLVYEDYNYLTVGDSIFHIAFDRKRDYYVSNTITADYVSTKQKRM